MEPKDRLPPATAVLLHQEHDNRPAPLPRGHWIEAEVYLSSVLIKNAEELVTAADPSAAYGAILIADRWLARLWVRTEGDTQQKLLIEHARTLRRLYLQAEALEERGLDE